jgi:tetratricopeptide (TPR) repeat protein
MAKAGKRTAAGKKVPVGDLTFGKDALQTLLALASQIGDVGPESDLDRAQEKIFDAWEAPNARRRVTLAKEALAISPLCADAYSILAQEAKRPQEALDLYRQAAEAGKQALGDEVFENDVGMFWGLIETRPYMRALHGLAQALFECGHSEDAVQIYNEMLRLNPDDNQGVRYGLLDILLGLGRDSEAADLLKRYKDDSSGAWAWSRALLRFREKGDGAVSREALQKAIGANPHVPHYLLGKKAFPALLPEYIGWGDENEAIAYAYDADEAWNAAPAAKAWLRASLARTEKVEATGEDERIDDAVLALLYLGLHEGDRAWKSFDWDAMNRLYEKGLISNPVGRAKSVAFSDEGLEQAQRLYRKLFVEASESSPPTGNG